MKCNWLHVVLITHELQDSTVSVSSSPHIRKQLPSWGVLGTCPPALWLHEDAITLYHCIRCVVQFKLSVCSLEINLNFVIWMLVHTFKPLMMWLWELLRFTASPQDSSHYNKRYLKHWCSSFSTLSKHLLFSFPKFGERTKVHIAQVKVLFWKYTSIVWKMYFVHCKKNTKNLFCRSFVLF